MHAQDVTVQVQLKIAWDAESPTSEIVGEEKRMHAGACFCGPCQAERKRLHAIRRAEYAARCEAECDSANDRVRYYEERAEQSLPLFDTSMDHLGIDWPAVHPVGADEKD